MGNREKEIMPDIKTYKVDGDVFDIPEDKVQEFLNDFPDAIEVKSFTVDQDTFDIPLNKVGEFTKDFPEAEVLTIKGEKPKKKDPYMKDWLQKIGGAAMKVPEQVMKGVKFTEKLYDAPGEFVRYGLERVGVSRETADSIGEFTKGIKYTRPDYWGMRFADDVNDAVKDTEVFKSLSEEAEKLHVESQRYDETITELLKEKDFGGAFGAIMLAGAESLPLSMIAAFGGPSGLATLGVVAGAEKYDELSERDDMDEAVKFGVSIAIGGLEAVTEMMGTAKIGGLVKSSFKGAGKEATTETIKAGLNAWFKGMYKKAGIWFAPMQEGIEEGVNAIGGNIVARYSGEDPDREIGDGVLDQTLGGMGGGTYFSAAGGIGKAQNALRKRLKAEVKTEEKVAPEAAKVPPVTKVMDKEKIPEVPKVQPPIPKYKIGETEYENKDTFLSEVEKFKGEKDTPKITVTDDQATLDEVDKILEIEEEPSKEVPKKEDEIEAAKITVSIGGIISPLLNEPESHFRGFSREKVIPHIKEAVKKFSDKVEQFFEGTLNLEGIETHEDLMRLVSTSPILRYWKQNAKDQLRIFIKNKADGKETRTVEDFVLSREAEEGKEAPTEEVKEEVTKSIFDQEVDLLEGEKEEAMHVIKAEEQQKVGDIVEFKDSKGDIQEGNFRGIGKDNNAVIEVIAKKDGKTFQNTFLIPVDDVKFPKTFPKEEISKIDYALENNLYQEWIKEGKMTANDAKTIIESATLEVPQDIIDLANKEIKQTERVTVEGKPPPDSPEYPKWVAEESSDVDEIAGAHTRLTEEGEGQVAPWQEGLLGMKVNPKSFADFSDKAHKAFGLAKQWFDVKRDKVQGYDSGFGIDDIAKELSDTYGVDVTPQMVVDFIIDNPSKKTGVQKGLINTLASKYKKLTGGDNIADHGKIIEAENEVLAQDVSALDELFNEDGTINVEVTNDKIDNNPDFFEGFRVNFSQEEITELKNIINNESRRKEFESKIKEIRTLQESIVGETLEPRVKRDEGEVTEEVKEPPLKSEQVKKKGESLLAQFSGIRGYFDVSKQKKKGKQEKQRDELKGFLDQKMQEELNAAETQEEKDAITKDYNKKLKDTERLFSRDKFTAQQRALEVRRKIIKDFIGDNRKDLQRVHGNVVPAMLNSVNSAKTMKQVDHALDYMEGVMKKQKAKEEAILWSNRYDKLQKKLDPTTYADKKATVLKGKKNVTAEMLNKLSNIRNNLFNKTRDEGQQKATDLIDKVVAENRDMTAEEYESLEEYTTYGISEMTAEELGRVNDYIDDIVKGEKTRGYNEYLARKQEELERIEHFGTTIRGGKPKKASIYDDRTKLKPKSKRGILDFIRNSNFFSILNKLAQHEYRTNPEISQIYGSELERYWMHRIHEADNNYHDGIREITTKAHNKYKEIFGGDRKGSKLKRHLLERARASKYDLVEVKYKDVMGKEKSAKFTQEEMGYIYSILRNEDMHENLSKINPNKSMGGMIKYNPETDTFDKTDLAIQMEKTLDPEMKEWVEFIGDMYDNDLYDRYNETYKKFFVFDMPKSRLFAPLFRVTKENAGQVIDEMLQQETYSSMGYNRHLKQRVSNSNPIKIMPVSDVFFSYINKMERFHSRADVLQEMNRFFKNPDIVDAIEESGGTMYTKAINQFLERYAGINTPGRITKDVDYIRRQVTRASLALKPTIFLKQLVSFPAYGAFLPTGQLTKGMAKFWLDPAKNWKMLSESSYILNRYDAGFDRDIADAMIKDYKSKKPIIDNWLNHAMFMVKWGDRMPIILGGYAVYDYNYNKFKKEGQTHGEAHKNAIREFELATRLTQQSSDIADLGYWQSQSSWSKLFTMYATAPLSYQRMVSGGVRMAISGAKGSNWKTFRKGVKTAFIGHVILPVLFQFAANGFELDDEEERRDLLWAAVLGNINNYFAIGDMVQTIIDDVIRKRPWGYQATPVASIVTDTKKGITEAISLIGDIIEGEDITVEDYMDAIEKIARPPSLGFGLPFPGMFRTLEGIVNAIEDDDATAAKKIKWILGYSKKGLESHDTDKTKSYTHN